MNTGLIQTLLESVQALQASVKAIEVKLDNPSSVVALTTTEAPESGLQTVELPTVEEPVADKATKKHPLEDYKVTEKDIDSLVSTWDNAECLSRAGSLSKVVWNDYPFEMENGTSWKHAKPYLDPVSLHFKPWHTTDEDIPPSDVKDGELVAVLLEDGEIRIDDTPREWNWTNCVYGFRIVGYRPLSFVNPILDEEK